jgi:hypothetical protein
MSVPGEKNDSLTRGNTSPDNVLKENSRVNFKNERASTSQNNRTTFLKPIQEKEGC